MSRHDDSVYLGHMLDNARLIMERTRGVTREQFDQDIDLKFALTHIIQILGEAADKISNSTRTAHSGIPWRDIIGMRHRIVHDYMRIDEDRIWKTSTEDVPILEAQLKLILHE